MSLGAGTKLGPYEIQSPLGVGGMGEVYRARDTRLDRTVAIKILPVSMATNAEFRQRFEREARAISALQHASICALHDIGSQDGMEYLVMEHLEGETLAARLDRGALPAEQVLKIGAEIGRALAAAHRNGIVHRDVKPGNVMLTRSGAKLMDFGLAKPLTSTTAKAPPSFTATITMPGSPLTLAGTVVGTVQYMSPEQIQGQEADARSDIFALGCVLYEMATGKHAFEGKSQLSVASAILEKEPEPMRAIQPLAPRILEHLVDRCLRKDPEERWQSAADLASELEWIEVGGLPGEAASRKVAKPGIRAHLPWIVATLAMAAAATTSTFFFRQASAPERTIRSFIPPDERAVPVVTGDYAGPVVVSPDGSRLAYVAADPQGGTSLWVRELNNLHARSLPGTEGVTFPFWSPDSHSLGFFASSTLKTISIDGGLPSDVCEAPGGRGGSWGARGVILFSPDFVTPIYQVPATGGTARPVTKLEATHDSHRWPYFLPDGVHFLYLAVSHENIRDPNSGLYLASLDGKENRLLMRGLSNAAYGAGKLLFLRDTVLMAQAFDPKTGELSGKATPVAEDVQSDPGTWRAAFDVTGGGVLAYVSGGTASFQAKWYDREGKQLSLAGRSWTVMSQVRISFDGKRIAEESGDTKSDIWVYDVQRNVPTRFTFASESRSAPVWSRDGKWIIYSGSQSGHLNLYRKLASGMGEEELLLEGDNQPATATDWSPDGNAVLYSIGDLSARGELWLLPLFGDRKPKLLLGNKGISKEGKFSPDGRWLAYTSNESGHFEVYVIPFGEAPGGKWQISTAGGSQPIWRRDSKEIFYLSADGSLMSVPITLQPGKVEVGFAAHLFRPNNMVGNIGIVGTYDATADGKRFIVLTSATTKIAPITLVTNWAAATKQP